MCINEKVNRYMWLQGVAASYRERVTSGLSSALMCIEDEMKAIKSELHASNVEVYKYYAEEVVF